MVVMVSMDISLETEVSNLFQLQKRKSIELRTSTFRQRIIKFNKIEQWVNTNRSAIQKVICNDFKTPEEEVDLTIYGTVPNCVSVLKKGFPTINFMILNRVCL